MTGEEYDILAALLAREDQRAEDKVREDQLRADLRASDVKRWDGFEFRLDRVQATQEDMRREIKDLSKSLDVKLATAIEAETEQWRDVAATTKAYREQQLAGQVRKRLMTGQIRLVVAIIALILFAGLAFALFEHRDDISGDIATGIAAMAAVAAIIYGFGKK